MFTFDRKAQFLANRPNSAAPARASAPRNLPVAPSYPHFALSTRGSPAPRPLVQPKLQVSSPGDPYEREADEVADRVIRMIVPPPMGSAPAALQHKFTECGEEEKTLQTKHATSEVNEPALDTGTAVRAANHGGELLPKAARDYFEPRFGHNFSRVRVHADAQAAEAARAVQARAYTIGHHIVFGSGEYAPTTVEGMRLLAHELTHIVQQGNTSPADRALKVAPLGSPFDAQGRISLTPALIMRQASGPTKTARRGEAELRALAARPSEALAVWIRLDPVERMIVQTYMVDRYGLGFAQAFHHVTEKRRRAPSSIELTNSPLATPERLEAAGYRLARMLPNSRVEVWVHPTGEETWVLRNAPPPPPRPEHANVAEVRLDAEDLEEMQASLIATRARLQSMGPSDSGYRAAYKGFLGEFDDLQTALGHARDNAAGLRELTPKEDWAALEAQGRRLERLNEWRLQFQHIFNELPPPSSPQ